MSHSQFHSTNLFILRHAWLNLWDKHMTTGRINQVTTFQATCKMQVTIQILTLQAELTFQRQGVFVNKCWFAVWNTVKAKLCFPPYRVLAAAIANNHASMTPDLTNFKYTSSCHYSSNTNHDLQRELQSTRTWDKAQTHSWCGFPSF